MPKPDPQPDGRPDEPPQRDQDAAARARAALGRAGIDPADLVTLVATSAPPSDWIEQPASPGGARRWTNIATGAWLSGTPGTLLAEVEGAWLHRYQPGTPAGRPAAPATGSPLDGHTGVRSTFLDPPPADDAAAWALLDADMVVP